MRHSPHGTVPEVRPKVGELTEHAGACTGEVHAEGLRDGGCNIGEGGTHADIHGNDLPPVDQQRNVFPRVVGAVVGRVAAVVGGDHQHVVLAQLGKEPA